MDKGMNFLYVKKTKNTNKQTNPKSRTNRFYYNLRFIDRIICEVVELLKASLKFKKKHHPPLRVLVCFVILSIYV